MDGGIDVSTRNKPLWRGAIALEILRFISAHPGCRPSEAMAGVLSSSGFRVGWLWMRHLHDHGFISIHHPYGVVRAKYTLTERGQKRLATLERLNTINR